MPGVGERGRKAGRVVPAAPEGDTADRRERFDRWFDPCVDVAFRVLHDPEEAADTVQEVFASTKGPPRGTPFGTWALRSTRDEALNRLGRRWRPGGPGGSGPAPGEPPDLGDESTEVAWAANAALGASDASVLDLHLRHGFGVPEVAEALGLSANEAHQLLFRLKRRLGAAVRAWGLWSARRPDGTRCDGLEVAIEGSAAQAFGPEVVRAITQHAKDCRTCQHHQPIQGSPEAVFAAAPILPAGSVLRERVRAALGPQAAPPAAEAGGPDASASPAPPGPAADPAGPGGLPAPGGRAVPPEAPPRPPPPPPPPHHTMTSSAHLRGRSAPHHHRPTPYQSATEPSVHQPLRQQPQPA
jgi:DNA-directed RNA polymerase specialized sigma24 family protein